jgi:hypothetical protein
MAEQSTLSMSDAVVKKATGRNWVQWFRVLDHFPKSKAHAERAQWLYDHHLKKGWWCQMVTVTYEQAQGLRAKHETTEGWQVSGSKTVPISVSKLYDWWVSAKKRGQWLPKKDFRVTSATKDKYLHLDWPGDTKVDINFWPKGAKKTLVQVQHRKLPTAAAGRVMKVFWKAKLDRLAELLR